MSDLSSGYFYERIEKLLAEIQRLQSENHMMTEQAAKFRDTCIEKDKILTQMADCWSVQSWHQLSPLELDLLKRAREATKDE